jgi:hypothetical protein
MTTLISLEEIQQSLLSSLALRKHFLNGNFDIWQRGTTVTNPANNSYLADRWQYQVSADGGTLPTSIVRSQQLLTPGEIPGSVYFHRIAPNGAGSSLGNSSLSLLAQRIEHANAYFCGAGKKITFSFYARASVAGKKLGLSLIQNYGDGGSPSGEDIIKGGTITLTSSWVKYTHTFTTVTHSGKTFGTNNNNFAQIVFWNQWGSTIGNIYIGTGVAAEGYGGSGTIDIAQIYPSLGEFALPFIPKSRAEEEYDCMRHYEKIGAEPSGTYPRFANGQCETANQGEYIYHFRVPKRNNQYTLETNGIAAHYGMYAKASVSACNAVPSLIANSSENTKLTAVIKATTAANMTQGSASVLIGYNNATAFLAFANDL